MNSVTADIKASGVPESWKDTLQMQALYTLQDKGYKKKLIWQQSTVDASFAGVFADEFIAEGEVIRVLEKDVNKLIFKSRNDLPPLTSTSVKYLAGFLFFLLLYLIH